MGADTKTVDVLAVTDRAELVRRFSDGIVRIHFIDEVEKVLETGRPHPGAMRSWGLTEDEFWAGVRDALPRLKPNPLAPRKPSDAAALRAVSGEVRHG